MTEPSQPGATSNITDTIASSDREGSAEGLTAARASYRLRLAGVGMLWRDHNQAIVVAFAGLVAAFCCLLGEKIDINNGFGWDGNAYGAIAKDPYGELIVRGYPSNSVQRSAPFVIAHGLLWLYRSPIQNADVIRLFIALDIVGITLTSWFMVRTLGILGAGTRAQWIAVLALTGNYAVAKWLAYYPVLADLPGLVLGAALVHAFVRGSRWQLFALTFLAAFSWPAAYYQGLVLTLWAPFRSPTRPGNGLFAGLALVAATLVSAAFAGWALYLLEPQRYATIKFNVHEPMRDVIWVAVACLVAYLFFGTWHLARTSLRRVAQTLPRVAVHWNTWLAIALLVVAAQWIVRRVAAAVTDIELDVYPHMVVSGIFRPGIFFVSHVVFYGPIVVLAACYWPRICRRAAELGPGLPLVLGIMLLLGVGSESRRVINFFPLLIVLTVAALDAERWSWRAIVGFGALSIITSKVWLTIGPLGDPNNLSPILFMNLGPWMRLDGYVINLAMVVAVGAVLAVLIWFGASGVRSPHADSAVGERALPHRERERAGPST